jgi:hypothetical protein
VCECEEDVSFVLSFPTSPFVIFESKSRALFSRLYFASKEQRGEGNVSEKGERTTHQIPLVFSLPLVPCL